MYNLLLFLLLTVVLVPTIPTAAQSTESGANTVNSSDIIERKAIEGDWVRPDGGYVLQLRDVIEDGSLNATYLNPKRINVSQAKTEMKNGLIAVFIELRDVNYPGSTYTLQYDPTDDRLKGNYFQAALGQNFAVEFLRIK